MRNNRWNDANFALNMKSNFGFWKLLRTKYKEKFMHTFIKLKGTAIYIYGELMKLQTHKFSFDFRLYTQNENSIYICWNTQWLQAVDFVISYRAKFSSSVSFHTRNYTKTHTPHMIEFKGKCGKNCFVIFRRKTMAKMVQGQHYVCFSNALLGRNNYFWSICM